jgi:hypothetical protein
MKLQILIIFSLIMLSAEGCGLFRSKREELIRERIQKLQEEIDRRADSVREERLKMLNDSTDIYLQKSLDSLKRSSDSLEKVIKKNLEELKKSKK